ncbi:type I restriction enzyme S subunit [Arcicella aurantiaca]|uniref:Type I restriction enzyme S subunit n=1 Tax=Arcicella aurantiaca TaxID=591202 RepID=A0A316DET8_9BACT|nr:restriction endonuclease subunit S [Arcicella aurantiaca]PWK16098.1 type I restriction enzyme S subunit [Arcicella aurantiaca]
MKSNYKRIGDCIRLVDERNKGLKVTNLLGVSITKQFIPSVANIIGTDMENYKIIRKNQFACSTMQVRRDKKMPVALLKEVDEAIISQAYPIFEVVDETMILPEYLMMWFSRQEFDREACFYAIGGVRGSLEWEDFCDMQLPVPSLEKQQEIVREYHVLLDRIALNKQLIQKLEETAQTIYKQWFVDFEFPNENGLPYKTNGGEMIESELGEIPKGWRVGELFDLLEIKYGKDYKHLKKGNIPLYGSGGIMGYFNKSLYEKSSILIPRKGTLNNILLVNKSFWSVDTMFYSIMKLDFGIHYTYFFLKTINFGALDLGSAVPSMTTSYLNEMQILVPTQSILEKFDYHTKKIIQSIDLKIDSINNIEQIKDLLLSKLSTQ